MEKITEWEILSEKYGTLYCQKRGGWCASVDENTGLCRADICTAGQRQEPPLQQIVKIKEERNYHIPDRCRMSRAEVQKQERNRAAKEQLMNQLAQRRVEGYI